MQCGLSAVSLDDPPPERFGPFLLLRLLGAGGMGSAYLAQHADSSRLLVLKRLHPELLRDPTIFKRFVHEAEVATHVQHPNVAQVVAMGATNGEPFFATEFVFGLQLAKLVDRIEEGLSDPMPLPLALLVASELMQGLAAVHGAVHRQTGAPLGLLHRDIGARNVLLGFDGRVRIIDLGLGKSALADWQTAHEVLAGSPDYMAPEQAMGARVDARADVYAAAVTIWELLAGRKRIREESVAKRIQRALSAQPEPLVRHRPEASSKLEAMLMSAMEPTVERRTPSAALLAKGLEDELRRTGKVVTSKDVAEWLDGACATLIAKERRWLQESQDAQGTPLTAGEGNTQFYVRNYLPEPPAAPHGLLEQLATNSAAAKLAELVDPEALRKHPKTGGLALLGVFVGVMALAALVTALLIPSPAQVVPLEVQPSPPVPVVPVVQVPPPPTVPPIRTTTVSPVAPKIEAIPMTPEVASRKKGLVGRLRQARKLSFEIQFQRRLTALSARLTRARSMKELDEIEGALLRMEREN